MPRQPSISECCKTPQASASTACSPFCSVCGDPISSFSICGVCVPCQKGELKWRANPRNFEGKKWQWRGFYYVPIQMCYGTVQTRYIEYNAEQSWRRFEKATGRTRQQLKAQGFRVKRITVAPDWKTNKLTTIKQ